MRCRWVGLLVGSLIAVEAAAVPRVSLELVTEPGFPLNGTQRWLEVLKDLEGIHLRIRGGNPGDQVEVTNLGTEAAPSYHVLGILTNGNRLHLPGAEFGMRDREGIAQWLDKLREEGIEGLTATRAAFGLTSKELVEFHERLAKPITFETKGVRTGNVARQIVKLTGLDYSVTAQAQQAFARNEPMLDELQGLSSGTALAAALRPLGLVMSPEKPRGAEVRMLICDVREVEEAWPIGWPSEALPRDLVPPLYEYLTVEIADTPLADAIAAIHGRVQASFLYDHNGMARQQIDPATSKVSFPRKRTQYKRALDQLLSQGGLMSEVRVDESGTAFLWISPRRR